MKANVYEGMFLLNPDRVGSNWGATLKELEGIVTNRQAKILYSGKWDERRLAYDIQGHRKGVYVLTYFEAPGPSIAEIERDCQLSPLVLRTLILKLDPRHVEGMLARATSGTRAAESGERAPTAPPAEAPADIAPPADVPADIAPPADAPADVPADVAPPADAPAGVPDEPPNDENAPEEEGIPPEG